MYDCTQSRDAINHYLPKFPEYCPAYHSLALFQTFQYPWLFEKGRSSASSMSLFRTHRRSTAEQKCESKCRKQKKKKEKAFNLRNIVRRQRDKSEYSHRQSFSYSFWLLLSQFLIRSPWESRTFLTVPFGIFLCFSPQWLKYIDAQPEMAFICC